MLENVELKPGDADEQRTRREAITVVEGCPTQQLDQGGSIPASKQIQEAEPAIEPKDT